MVQITLFWSGPYVIVWGNSTLSHCVFGNNYTLASNLVKLLESVYGFPAMSGFAGGCHYTFTVI